MQITFFTVINLFHCDKCGKFLHKLLSANIPLHVVQQRFYLLPWCPCCHPTGCCYNNVMKNSHCCVKRAMYPNCPVCFEVRNLRFNETSLWTFQFLDFEKISLSCFALYILLRIRSMRRRSKLRRGATSKRCPWKGMTMWVTWLYYMRPNTNT